LLVFVLSAIFLIVSPNNFLRAQSDSTEFDLFSVNDGPYVLQQSISANIVFYVCNGFFESKSFGVDDTIMFRGFCHDTNSLYAVATNEPILEPDIVNNVSKIVTVSDIHGRYDIFEDILIKSKVIDENLNWIFGDGHLVIDGDIFDRGDYVTECLWLFYRLEQEARKAGGAVHTMLGNHELMVLRADNRYINEKYLKGIVEVTAISHEDLFSKRSALGRWLRSKHTVIKLNDILFVHGGIAPSIMDRGLSISDINDEVRLNIDISKDSQQFSKLARYLFGSEGPFWYRGYFEERENKYAKTNDEDIDNLLSYFDVKTIVVGHTGVDQIEGYYDNRVINQHLTLDSSTTQALYWEDNKFYRITSAGERQLID